MRYYFHIRDKDGLIRDEEGTELPHMSAATDEAVLSARDLAADDLRRGRGVLARWIEIADRSGKMLKTIPVRDTLH